MQDDNGIKEYKSKDISGVSVYIEPLPENLISEISNNDGKQLYCVSLGDEILRTPEGNLIVHKDDRPMRELAAELDFSDTLDVQKISLYGMCANQIDIVEGKHQIFTEEEIDHALLNDPIFRTCAGPEVVEQLKYYQMIDDYLKDKDIILPSLPQSIHINDHSFLGESENNFNRLVTDVFESYRELNIYQKTVFLVAIHVFDSPILAIMLAQQKITPHEFAIVFMTSQCINSKVWGDTTDRDEERTLIQSITRDIECILRYLQQFSPKVSETEILIKSGESLRLEFKSTLRWNMHSQRPDTKIEHAALKTIVAFLNTDGGTLIVGVQDDGTIIGIEGDNFYNNDKFLLHFTNLVNQRIGKQYNNLLHYDIKTIKDKKIFRVDCKRSSSAVFLTTGNQEEFFIRTGPSTVQLTSSDLLDYAKKHFNE